MTPIERRLRAEVENGIYLGAPGWVKKMRKMVESRPRSSDHPLKQRAVGRPKMNAIIEAVAGHADLETSSLQCREGGHLRGLAAWLGWHEGLVTYGPSPRRCDCEARDPSPSSFEGASWRFHPTPCCSPTSTMR